MRSSIIPKEAWSASLLKELGGKAFFAVRDEGIGIAEENKTKIFESFYHNSAVINTNGIEKSTGIGLSLTKSLVQVHRGEITVESKLGKGSTFTVIIPISKDTMQICRKKVR